MNALQKKADASTSVADLGMHQSRANLMQRNAESAGEPTKNPYYAEGTVPWDKSKGVPRWAQYDYTKDHAQVDQSSSAALPNYHPAENEPGWKYSQGVPKWAQNEYKLEAKRTLIASIKDGLIGSIYFDDHRIRTTHAGSPERSKDSADQKISRYNLDQNAAWNLFRKANDLNALFKLFYQTTDRRLSVEARKEIAYDHLDNTYKGWLSTYLVNTSIDALPAWVTPVRNKQEAFDVDTANPPDNITLFEVFTNVSNGKVEKWHPSRGIAAKFETDKQVVSVLKAALIHIKDDRDRRTRNVKFYEFIEHRIPGFAAQIRHPDTI